MALLILNFNNSEYQVFEVKDLEEAHYWFNRRIEKGPGAATHGWLAADYDKLPVAQWKKEYYAREARNLKEEEERREKAEFERLKKKFEDK